MIPHTLWQTYKTKLPPKNSLESIHSWLSNNSSVEWYYMDDDKCDQFIKDHFSDEFYQMYKSLPFGVMKSDVWRVAVIYVYGGIYADLDTKCLKPISTWLNTDKDLVVYVETPNGAICNYTFAAAPKHPALLAVLNTFMELYNSSSFLNKNSPTPIQDFGAGGWSLGILKHYGLENDMHLGGDYYNTVDKVKEENTYFYSYDSMAFSPHPNNNTCVYHQSASIFWNNNEYDSWRKQQQENFGIFGK
jgi:hypothetical protein